MQVTLTLLKCVNTSTMSDEQKDESLSVVSAISLLKHKQANIKVNGQRFGVIVTPFSRQSE